jgi:uncharacterized protein DUF6228
VDLTHHHHDGYVHVLSVELTDGLAADGTGTFEGNEGQDVAGFLTALADDWCGWPGARRWASMEGDLAIAARHDGKGHVELTVTLRRDWPDGWSACLVLTVEAGEELSTLARQAEHLRPS